MVTKIIIGLSEGYFEGNLSHNLTLSWSNGAAKSAFQVSMATEQKFPNSVEFSDILVPSPSNRAIHEVSRPTGLVRRAFVTGERL